MEAESLHRLVKLLLDSAEAATIEEAVESFSKYGVRIAMGPNVRRSAREQIIALTSINAAARAFKGNVSVEAEDFELVAPGFEGQWLSDFLRWANVGAHTDSESLDWPTIYIGDDKPSTLGTRSIRAWADGWQFGLGNRSARSDSLFAPASVAAGGLAVSEAFSILRQDNPYAGRRNISMSLWSLDGTGAQGPSTAQHIFPSSWLIGLGHLGQAYAWTVGFMKPKADSLIYLQDVDTISISTLSTSILSTQRDLYQMKTRVVAKWLEARGLRTAIVERRFDEQQKVGPSEPRLAMVGVDNPAARRVLEGTGFSFAVDAGLGAGYRDFRGIRVRTFPGPSRADLLWAASEQPTANLEMPAYQALLDRGVDTCGVAVLASRAVGAPFVGCVAAGLVIAEIVRNVLDGPRYGVVDLNLRDPERCKVVRNGVSGDAMP